VDNYKIILLNGSSHNNWEFMEFCMLIQKMLLGLIRLKKGLLKNF